ncbi:hypothetical protein I6N90_21550 [Paenibacillus sp. GSMTC-2017]|uniref:hypothetical protein n=1 Tax=Paenibacillus sp. GSMTC-2017 TaxID=2794350 RepID=UPI0018D8C6E9|nr:hypothetical protein [Paenibacillus sp. GSMTC-2017]MBH5320382.1 hypothetical protein [Paenibacillus sp. GSMTC-2017]
MKKKFVSACLSLVLLLSSFGSVVHASEKKVEDETTVNFTSDIIVESVKIGSVEVTTVSSAIETKDGSQTTINQTKDYTIYPEYIAEYGSVFTDSFDQSEIIFSNNNQDVYIDGIKEDVSAFDENVAIAPQNVAPANNYMLRSTGGSDRGGISSICHYYSTTARTSYAFGCYESMNYNWVGKGWGSGEPTGKNISKIGILNTNSDFQTARNDVIRFESDYNSYQTTLATVILAVVGEAVILPWFGPGGLVALGILSASETALVVYQFSEAEKALKRAYSSITFL